MQLAGFNLDERADGNGKAATTWIAVELLPEGHAMNENGSIEGGWRDSDLRAYLQDTVYRAIPKAVRGKLVRVRKRQIEEYREGGNHVYQTTEDLVWIPDKDEIFGEDSLYYGLFRDSDENRRKKYLQKEVAQALFGSSLCDRSSPVKSLPVNLHRSARRLAMPGVDAPFISEMALSRVVDGPWWWLRSAYANGRAYIVISDGGSNFTSDVYNSGGVALGFCL